MTQLMNIAAEPLGALFAIFAVASCCQVVHGYIRLVLCPQTARNYVAVYEVASLAHLVICTAFLFDAYCHAINRAAIDVIGSPAADVLLWLNAPVALAVVFAIVVGLDDQDFSKPGAERSWMLGVEAALAVVYIPPVLEGVGGAWPLVVIDALYYVIRSAVLLVDDRRLLANTVSPLSIVEAAKRLPEGLLYAEGDGRMIVMNNAMRACLRKLGLMDGWSDADSLWHELERRAAEKNELGRAFEFGGEYSDALVVPVGPGESRLFARSHLGSASSGSMSRGNAVSAEAAEAERRATGEYKRFFGAVPRYRIVSLDVSEEMRLAEEIAEANEELIASQRSLLSSVAAAQSAAEDEAFLRMRARVHDVIGQRLSMLHRALEDDNVSEEMIAQMKPLLNGITADLSNQEDVQPEDELSATVDAFRLAGVEISVSGVLPESRPVAELFADAVREAATNAVKHAHAKAIRVTFGNSVLEVSNDGTAPHLPLVEGTGLTTLRSRAEALGGSVEASVEDGVFTLFVTAGQ